MEGRLAELPKIGGIEKAKLPRIHTDERGPEKTHTENIETLTRCVVIIFH